MTNAGLNKVSSFRPVASAAILGLVWVAGFTPSPAAAQGTPQQQQACTPDVMRLCNAFIPDVAKITACMRHNRASISPACRVALAGPPKKRAPHGHHSHRA
jgi:hypothetical protein